MKPGALFIVLVFGLLSASACATKEQESPAAPLTPVMDAQGEMAGEVSDTSVILQTRLTSVAGLTQDDVAGAAGVAQFEWSESPAFAGGTKTEWMKAQPEHDYIVKKQITGLKPGTQYHYHA